MRNESKYQKKSLEFNFQLKLVKRLKAEDFFFGLIFSWAILDFESGIATKSM